MDLESHRLLSLILLGQSGNEDAVKKQFEQWEKEA